MTRREKGWKTQGKKLFTALFDWFGTKERGRFFPIKKNWNCDCGDGKVRRGIGMEQQYRTDGEPLTVESSNMREVFFAEWNDGGGMADEECMFLVKLDGYLYAMEKETGAVEKKLKIGSRASHYAFRGEKGKIYNLFCGENAVVYTHDLSTYVELLSGNMRGHAVCGCRYFALMQEGILRCSAPYNPNHFSDGLGGDTIYLPSGYGDAVGLAAEGDWLYIFMQRGIFRLLSRADCSDLLLEPVGYNGEEIFWGSVLATGEGILFLTERGVHRVRGKEVRQICEHLDVRPVHGTTVFRVGKCDGMAIFEFSAIREDGYKERKRLAVYSDGSDGFYMDTIMPLTPSGYTCNIKNVYRFKKNSEEGIYTVAPHLDSEEMYFGTQKRKRLKAVRLYGVGKARFNVWTGRQLHVYDLSFVDGVAQTRLFEKGERFTFALFPGAKSAIERMEIDYTLWEDER